MNVFWPEGLQKLAASGEITFKDGEKLNLNLVRKMDNGLYLINLKGKTFTAELQSKPQGSTIRAEVVKAENGQLQLKIIPKADRSGNPMQATIQTAINVKTDGQTASSQVPQKLVLTIPQGTIEVKPGEKLPVEILKVLDNGKTLVTIKNNLFEVKLPTAQLLKNFMAEVVKTDSEIELSVPRAPAETLNPNFVRQEVGKFDIAALMRAFGKFQKVDVTNITPEALKNAVKNSGLFMENKLFNGEAMDGDEKVRAYLNSDTPAKDGITRMQVANMLLAGGMLAFLKTKDEQIEDTYVRYKKSDKGQGTVYISTEFSNLGETFIIIRSLNKHHDVMVKTEVDISEQLKDVKIENTRIHWYKFNKNDLETIDIKNEISLGIGSFEVIT